MLMMGQGADNCISVMFWINVFRINRNMGK